MNRGRSLARLPCALTAAVALTAACAPAVAAPPHAPGEVLVRFKDGVVATARADALADRGAHAKRRLPLRGLDLVAVAPDETVSQAVARFEADPRVEWAEPNYLRHPAFLPNDPAMGSLWALENTGQTVDGAAGLPDADIDAPAAWDITTGDPSVVVAVVDTGAILDHPDLAPNLWTNPNEVAGDGIDNDGNQIVDDVHGADFTGAVPDGDPTDLLADATASHGTHVASIVAGRGGNGLGITGVAPGVRIMPLRFLGPEGVPAVTTVADELLAFEYARKNGAHIVNGSYGGVGTASQTERAAIAASSGMLFVFAAGNGGKDRVGDSNEIAAEAFYPCSYDLPNVICVGASDQNDDLAPFSNYGATTVDLAAPGTRVLGAVGTMRPSFFFDDFEGPLEKWSLGGTWARTQSAAASGTASLTDSPAGNYGASNDSSVELTPPLNLSGAEGCRVRADIRTAIAPVNDALVLETSGDDGASWTPDAKWSGTTANSAFTSTIVDLTQRDGLPVVRLRYRLTSDAADQADGVWIDNVDISCLSPGSDYTGAADEFGFKSGTSMATPVVAGVAALVRSADPALSPVGIKARILETVDPLPGMAGKTVTGGRLNARSAVKPDLVARTGPTESATTSSAVVTGTVAVHVPLATARFEVGTTTAYEMGAMPSFEVAADDVEQTLTATLDTLAPGRTYHYRLVAEGSTRRSTGQDLTFTTAAAPSLVSLGVPAATKRPAAKSRPCGRFKGQKKSTCLRRQAALKNCAKLRAGAKKKACIIRAKRLHQLVERGVYRPNPDEYGQPNDESADFPPPACHPLRSRRACGSVPGSHCDVGGAPAALRACPQQ